MASALKIGDTIANFAAGEKKVDYKAAILVTSDFASS
jgi:hypothetical protein